MPLIGPLILALAALADPVPVESAELRCAGGAMIFFEPASDEIASYGVERLTVFAKEARRLDLMNGLVRVESGGDGFGNAFDAEISRRRSVAINDFLVARGFAPGNIAIVVGDELNPKEGDIGDQSRMGWVALRISPEEYARRYPPNLITECF